MAVPKCYLAVKGAQKLYHKLMRFQEGQDPKSGQVTFEKAEPYMRRNGGFIAFYAALMQSLRPGNPVGLDGAWKYLARSVTTVLVGARLQYLARSATVECMTHMHACQTQSFTHMFNEAGYCRELFSRKKRYRKRLQPDYSLVYILYSRLCGHLSCRTCTPHGIRMFEDNQSFVWWLCSMHTAANACLVCCHHYLLLYYIFMRVFGLQAVEFSASKQGHWNSPGSLSADCWLQALHAVQGPVHQAAQIHL